ncbi:MAG: hypothetical protein ACRDZ4_02035 [Egibacteraceae bacterium]
MDSLGRASMPLLAGQPRCGMADHGDEDVAVGVQDTVVVRGE